MTFSNLSGLEKFSKSMKAGFEGHDAMREKAEKAFGPSFAHADKSPRVTKLSQPSNRLYKKGGHVEHERCHSGSEMHHQTMKETQTGHIHHKEKLPTKLYLPTKVKLATGGVVPAMPGERGSNRSVSIPKNPTLAETQMKKGGKCRKAGGGIIPMSHGGYEREDREHERTHRKEAEADRKRRPFHDVGYERDDLRKHYREMLERRRREDAADREREEHKATGGRARVRKAIGGSMSPMSDWAAEMQDLKHAAPGMVGMAAPDFAPQGEALKRGGRCHKAAGGETLYDNPYRMKKGGKTHKAGGGIIPMRHGGESKKKVLVGPDERHSGLKVGHYVERVKRAMGGSGKIRHGEMTEDGHPTHARSRTLESQY